MDVKKKPEAVWFLDPEIKMEKEEDSADFKEGVVEEEIVLLKTSGRRCGDAGHEVKQELSGETSGNWDSQLQEFLKTLQTPPSVEETSQQSEMKQSTDPKMSQIVSLGTADANMCRIGDAEQDSSIHRNTRSCLEKEKERALTGNSAKAELRHQHFQMLCYQEARSPLELFCRQWLEPEGYTKELELVTLEQFLAVLPLTMQSWVKERGPETCAQAVTLALEFLQRQPEGKISILQVTGFSEAQPVISPNAMKILPVEEKLQLFTVEKHRAKGSGNVSTGDDWLSENQRRKPLVDNTGQVEQPTTAIKTDQESDFGCQGEADEKQHKAEDGKRGIKPTGVNKFLQSRDIFEGIRLPATEEEKMFEERGEESQLLMHKDPEGLEEELYRCWHCGESFGSSVKLVTHERTHVDEKLYRCSCCGESERIHAGQKPHKCSHCGKTFGSNPGGERLHTCSEYGKSCSQRLDLLKHQRAHTGEKPYQCLVCAEELSNGSGLKLHQRTHTGEKPYKCLHCGKCFSWSSHLISHGRIHSAICSYCGRSFAQKPELRKHEKTHKDVKFFSCFACGQTFGASSELVAHVRTHKQTLYRCSDCGRTFNLRANFRAHVRTHTGERPYICSVCGKNFTSNSVLRRHHKIHEEQEIYSCSQCGKTFQQRTGQTDKALKCFKCFRGHQLSLDLLACAQMPAEEKQYKCPACGKTFRNSSHLITHQSIHTGIQLRLECVDCGRNIVRRPNLIPAANDPAGPMSHKCSGCQNRLSQISVS